ncbi:hypothetical protein LMIY3S_03517 [Labrys miyagiensis]
MVLHPALLTLAAFIVVVGTALNFANAASRQRAVAGTLTCQAHGGMGLCTYKPAGLAAQRYNAQFLYLDPQGAMARPQVLVWRVFEADERPRDLSGTYLSTTKTPTFAAGLGADVLVGGEGQSIALQTLSGSGSSQLGGTGRMGQMRLERLK